MGRKERLIGGQTAKALSQRGREKQNSGKASRLYDSQQVGVFVLIQAVQINQELDALTQYSFVYPVRVLLFRTWSPALLYLGRGALWT